MVFIETGGDKSVGHVLSVGSVHVGGIISLSVLLSKVLQNLQDLKPAGSQNMEGLALGVWN